MHHIKRISGNTEQHSCRTSHIWYMKTQIENLLSLKHILCWLVNWLLTIRRDIFLSLVLGLQAEESPQLAACRSRPEIREQVTHFTVRSIHILWFFPNTLRWIWKCMPNGDHIGGQIIDQKSVSKPTAIPLVFGSLSLLIAAGDMLSTLSSLVAPQYVVTATYGAISHDKLA